LERFREGKVRILVTTNVASRGIHIDGISHVINYNMPEDVEEYVHRIGRTGRAGASGTSISFADEDDSHEINKLEEYLNKKIKFVFPEDELLIPIPEKHKNIKVNKPDRKKNYKRNYKKPNRRR
jgi:ATP-dependent RNA helicase RhlB